MTYDFPVALEPVYTKAGRVVPKVQSVVRQDSEEPLSAVSMKYKLIPHVTVVDGARSLVEAFGEREEKFLMSANGARLVYQSTYKSPDQTLRLKLGDVVGLRIFVENSYNTTRAVSVRIGFLVLSCLNGMVTSKDVFCYRCKHIGEQELHFPKPEDLYPAFQHEVSNLNHLGDIVIDHRHVPYLVADAQHNSVLSNKGADAVLDCHHTNTNAWALMQSFTHHTTHGTERMSEIGKLNRLDRVGKWFNNVFRDGGYTDLIARAERGF